MKTRTAAEKHFNAITTGMPTKPAHVTVNHSAMTWPELIAAAIQAVASHQSPRHQFTDNGPAHRSSALRRWSHS